MGIGDATKSVADKASHPYVLLTGLIITASGMFGGVKWGLAEMSDANQKADTAVQAVKEMKGALDMFIKLQMESNALQRVEMGSKANVVPAATAVDTLSKSIVMEYEDTLGAGIKRKGDTIWIPKAKKDSL